MSKIKKVLARQIIDSRGIPTIETQVILSDDIAARSAVPSGVSKGTYEAVELRDGGPKYGGMGVSQAVKNVNEIIGPKLEGMEILDQKKIDRTMIELDGTQNKSKLGSNAIISVSQAAVRAGAKSSLLPTPLYIRQFVNGNLGKKIPTPMFNVLEGGKHGSGELNLQEFLVVPASSKSFSEGLEIGLAVYHSVKKKVAEKGMTTLIADEGGFSPNLSSNQEGFALIKEAIDASGFVFSLDVFMGTDAAANSFIDGKVYRLKDKSVPYSASDLTEFYKNLFAEYALIYMEDLMGEDDWDGWKKVYQALGDKTIIAGDDLTTTNPYRLQLALDNKAINGIIIKPNQIGTITEAIAVMEIARYTGLKVIVSHRAGETTDPFIADFAVGVGADYMKLGAPARERIVKYNKLLQIEEELSRI